MLTFKLQPTTANINFCRELVAKINKDYPNAACVHSAQRQVWVEITDRHSKNMKKYVETYCNIKNSEGKDATI